jgi:hypothetical protein
MIRIELTQNHIDTHYLKVSTLLKKRITNVLNKGYIYKKNRANPLVSKKMRRFLSFLKKDKGLETLIKATPTRLERIISNYIKSWKDITISSTDDYQILYNIFVTSGYEKISKSDFISSINLNTCSYCNRQYIFKIGKDRIIKPEIDHFFPKGRHPLLAVSVYNLIPSCETCNGTNCKYKTDPHIVGLISPYIMQGDEFLFSYKLIKLEKKAPLLGSKVELILSKKIQSNSDLFGIEEFYKNHDDHVVELMLKSKIKYSIRYKKFLFDLKGIHFSNKEFNRMIVGNYTDINDLHKRPLSKMYRDIAFELGLITEHNDRTD